MVEQGANNQLCSFCDRKTKQKIRVNILLICEREKQGFSHAM